MANARDLRKSEVGWKYIAHNKHINSLIKEAVMIQHTDHSSFRAAQRGLTDEEIEYVFQFGSRFHSGGALIYFLRRQDLPKPDLRWDWANHLVGTALVCTKQGDILVTVWRNRRSGLKLIRKKENHHYNPLKNYRDSMDILQ
jgi:hypothetical protein